MSDRRLPRLAHKPRNDELELKKELAVANSFFGPLAFYSHFQKGKSEPMRLFLCDARQ